VTFRSEQHRRNVASLPCIKCGLEGSSQCAHANHSLFGKSLGMKSSDLATFPLCAPRPGELGCHYRHDQYTGITRDERDELELMWVYQTIATLTASGKLKAVK